MERIRALINKLQQQSEQKADPVEMLGTVKLLQLELSAQCTSSKHEGSSKVAVVFPSGVHSAAQVSAYEPIRSNVKEPEPKPQLKTAEIKETVSSPKKHDNSGWLFDPVEEVPTLAHQKEIKELNDVIGQNIASLNDKLKTEKKELVSVLKEGPVKDLKKAIGVNDRFVFLNELFRGDEAMYERSIKTINNFRIYPEAEYWIERELKVKLGWDEKKNAVQHFCQLVKRRFS
jgi:hypothetical protein